MTFLVKPKKIMPFGRIAVVVVHGMGNQYPMQTLRGFVESLRPDDAVLYSSPNRITDDLEVRRLSYSRQPFDYYEYYWAHHVEEPGIAKVFSWSFKLLFIKKPSTSLAKHIWPIRLFIILLPLLIIGLVALGYCLFKNQLDSLLGISVYGLTVVAVLRFLWGILSDTIAGAVKSSIGDVIKYTVPSPENILVRDKIKKEGMKLLRNLHEAKKPDGKSAKYDKIILVGHSLGSIVAYDMLSSLFAEYHGSYKDVPVGIKQKSLSDLLGQYNNPTHSDGVYQATQEKLFEEYGSIGNQWRVSHFITMGSPLTHASAILNENQEAFEKKKAQREFPTSPPQLDHEDNHFAFQYGFSAAGGGKVQIKMLHHAAHFAMTQWTNIYFENDWIGGAMENEFGKGVKDIEVTANDNFLKRAPLSTHTKYWDSKERVSLEKLKAILEKAKHDSINKQASKMILSKR